VAENIVLWRDSSKVFKDDTVVQLHSSLTAKMSITSNGVTGSDHTFRLQKAQPSEHLEGVFRKFPHLRGCTAFCFKDSDLSSGLVDTLLTSQLCLSASNSNTIIKATGVQMAGVLDDKFAPLILQWDLLGCL
jgi:hypothetical protein